MKKIALLMIAGCLATALLAQDIQPFSFEIRRGEKIDEEIMAALTSKTWTPFRQYEVDGGMAKLSGTGFFALKFFPENEFRATSAGKNSSGSWQLEEQQYLRLEIADPASSGAPLRNFSGIYSIYSISNNQLVLLREIRDDEKIVYYCKGNSTKPIEEAQRVSNTEQDKAAREAARKQLERQMLIDEIQVEMLLRGERWKRKYEDLSTSQLKEMRQQLWTYGKYDKVRALRNELKMEASANDIALPADFETMKYGQLKRLKKEI